MGFLMPKPQLPSAPPPPPTAPDFSASLLNRSRNANIAGALGGTFLTAGQKLGSTNSGRSILG